LHHHGLGAPVDIGRRKAEQSEAGANESILAAVVIDHPITMVAAVEFDRQIVSAIEQIWPAYGQSTIVMDGTLNLWPRESGEYEKHAKASLHRRLRIRLGQVNYTPQPCDALGSRMLTDICAQLVDGHQLRMKE
jgi:hypothetical protein